MSPERPMRELFRNAPAERVLTRRCTLTESQAVGTQTSPEAVYGELFRVAQSSPVMRAGVSKHLDNSQKPERLQELECWIEILGSYSVGGNKTVFYFLRFIWGWEKNLSPQVRMLNLRHHEVQQSIHVPNPRQMMHGLSEPLNFLDSWQVGGRKKFVGRKGIFRHKKEKETRVSWRDMEVTDPALLISLGHLLGVLEEQYANLQSRVGRKVWIYAGESGHVLESALKGDFCGLRWFLRDLLEQTDRK